jgi:hypothetical protein
MANDPLPLPDMAAEPPTDNAQGADDLHGAHEAHDAHDAEYETIFAEIAATERGRWFLSEHIKRNRAADTDRLVGSLARAGAAMRGDAVAQTPRPLADDLAKLAAAIGQVEAVMAASAPTAADGLAASERIQDVAFALREREIDTALCDSLESALFELGDAFARQDAAAERTQSAAALLRSVEANINTLIALVSESAQAEPASADAEPSESVAEAPDERSAIEPVLSDVVSSEPAATDVGEAPADAGSPRDDVPSTAAADDTLPPALTEEAVVSELLPDAGLLPEAPSSAATVEQSSEESTSELSVPVHDAGEDEVEPALQFLAEPAARRAEVPANDENTGIVESAETGIIEPAEDGVRPSAPDALEPTWPVDDDIESLLEAEPADPLPTATPPAGAQEDLDDLFEPLPPEPDMQQGAVSAVQSGPRQHMFSPELPPPAYSAAELRPPAFAASAMEVGASPAEPPSVPVAQAPAAPAIPRPAPNDPLAAVRALSAEELIALFS